MPAHFFSIFFSGYPFTLFVCLASFVLFPCGSVGGHHSCMSLTFPIAILNGTCSFRSTKTATRSVSRVLLNYTLNQRTGFTCFHIHSSLLANYFCSIVIYFVPLRKCWGQHSFMSSTFTMTILNGTYFCASKNSEEFWKWGTVNLKKNNDCISYGCFSNGYVRMFLSLMITIFFPAEGAAAVPDQHRRPPYRHCRTPAAHTAGNAA